jgi:biofilm PGA synthesis lipoprotein PgaB
MVFRFQKKGLYLLGAVLAVSGILFLLPSYIGIPDPQKERAEASIYKEPEVSHEKRHSSFTRRMLAAQVLVFDCKDYRNLEDCIKKLKRVGVNTLIVRAFQNRGDRAYAFSRPRCSEGVYFETEHAPVVDPLLPRLVLIGHRHSLKVFAWMETRKMPLRHPDPEGARAIGYSFETATLEPLGMWSIFDEAVEHKLVDLYKDAVRCGIDGILIQDDLVMRHCEDFSPKAVALFEKETGKALEPEALYQAPFKDSNGRWYVSQYTDTFWEWSRWKNEKLLKIANKLIQASKAANPQIEFAMNFMYESVTDPKNAMAWLSQSLTESTKLPIDFYAIMAYHRQIKNELNLTDARTYEKISNMTANVLKLVDDPNKILMKVQLRDWYTGKQIPAVETDEVFRRINAEGRVSLAFVPYSAKARLDVIQHHFQ